MDTRSKVLLVFVLLVTTLSIGATFYRSVIQQDFEIAGLGVDVGEDYAYTWFMYEGEEYEIEIESTELADLLVAVTDEVGSPDESLLEEITLAYEDATAE